MTVPDVPSDLLGKKIIHIDMDAFYASVEQLDNPKLKGKPVAVGGNLNRGVVAAASYEARKYGVKSAMPSAIAARQCPNIIFVKPRFERYREISQAIHHIFYSYTSLVEPLSLDEAYLDVTHVLQGPPSATLIAQSIREDIMKLTGLTASAGVSYCKFLAKMASDVNKPNGMYVILPADADDYLKKLPIHKYHGIGKATAERMKMAGIFTGADLRKKSLEDLKLRYGKAGHYYFNICRGIDNRPVTADRKRKSISAERTLPANLMRLEEIANTLLEVAERTYDRYQPFLGKGRTITIKVKYGDFKQVTRSETMSAPITSFDELKATVLSLVDPSLLRDEGIRLLGVGIGNLADDESSNLASPQLRIDF